MRAPTDGITPERSVPMRFLVRSWEYRHPLTWAGVRLACGVFNLCLGVVLFSFGYWVGAVPLAGAALIFWTVRHLQHSVQS